MKLIVYLIFTILFCLSQETYAQTIKTKTYILMNVKGKKAVLKIEEFNQDGNLTKKIDCKNQDCSKAHIEVRVYNDIGQLVQDSIYTNQYGYHLLVWRTEYIYYNNGKLRIEKKVNETCIEGFDCQYTYYYDSTGKLMKIYEQNKCNNSHYFDFPIYFKYDSFGNKIEKVAKYRDTSLVFYKNIYQFDKNNNLISDTYYSIEHDSLELSSIREYYYDSQNRLLKKKWIISETHADSTGYTYYPNGLIKSEIRYPKYSDETLSWLEYSYDENSNIIERQLYYLNDNGRKRKGFKELFEYEYY